MSDFPDLREGEKWSDQSALLWRNLIDAVGQITALAVGPGLALDKSEQGWHLSLAPKPPVRISPPDKSVVLVGVPGEDNEGRPWLMVREVEYATPARLIEPPDDRDHPYRWRDVAFQAYPQIGRTPEDYFASLWDDRDDDGNLNRPTLETTFLTATFDGSAWILVLPKVSATAMVVVRDVEVLNTGSDRLIWVSMVAGLPGLLPDPAFRQGSFPTRRSARAASRPGVSPGLLPDPAFRQGSFPTRRSAWAASRPGVSPGLLPDPAFRLSSQWFLAKTWPPLRGRHYRAFLWQGNTIEDETNVLPAMQIAGTWWVLQQLTWGELDLQSSIPISDCQV